MKRNYASAVFYGATSMIALAGGLFNWGECYSVRNCARSAVYARAVEITPEVVKQAEDRAKKVGLIDAILAGAAFASAGLCGVAALAEITQREE